MESTMAQNFESSKRSGFKVFQWMEAIARYQAIKSTLFNQELTVFRILDMNRELLEVVFKEAPSVFVNNHELVGNLKYQDEFIQTLGKTVLTKNQFLCLTNAAARRNTSSHYPFVREWPVEIEKQVNHLVHESYRAKQNAAEIENESDCQLQQPASINRAAAIRDHYQNSLINKVYELSDQLDQHRIGTEQHKKLMSAMLQMQELMKSWNTISNLIEAPDANIFEIVEK